MSSENHDPGEGIVVAPVGHARRLAGLLLVVALVFSLAGTVGASTTDELEFSIEVAKVVKNVEPGTVVLLTDPPVATPEGLAGRECTVVATSKNQSSVHPGNDLVVETGSSRVVVADVEAEPGGVVNATGTVVMGSAVSISLVMGDDGIFSAGIEVKVDCAPGATTTTTTDEVSGTEDTTATTEGTTTTTEEATTTTDEVSGTADTTTTTDGTTTSSITDEVLGTEVLPFTGPDDDETRLGLVAMALVASGMMMVAGSRSDGGFSLPAVIRRGRRCGECDRDAEFDTPHGKLCLVHTRKALYADDELWVPTRLDRSPVGQPRSA